MSGLLKGIRRNRYGWRIQPIAKAMSRLGCMHACMHACACLCARVYACLLEACMCVCMYACMHVRWRTRASLYAYVPVCLYAFMSVCLYVCLASPCVALPCFALHCCLYVCMYPHVYMYHQILYIIHVCVDNAKISLNLIACTCTKKKWNK